VNTRLSPSAKALALLIAAYVLVCFSLAYRKYASFGTDSGDLGFFNNMFWWTINGRPFYCSGLGYHNFGIHAACLWALLIPAYWLVPGVPTLLFMQTLFLGATAIPVYLIARELLKDANAGVIAAAAFILLPPIVSQNVNQVEEPAFVAVFLLFSFYFYLKNQFGRFLLFAGIACLGRENVPLAIAMYGIYSLILRRSLKWILTPIVMGGAYFWFAMFVFMPAFRQGQQWHVMRMFKYLGDTPSAIVMAALQNPGRVIEHVLGGENINYILLLLQPMGWVLPFLTPAWLMALPDLAINTISDNGAMKVIPWHYNVFTGCFLFVGAIYSVRKIGGWCRQRWGGNPELVMVSVLLALSVAHWFIWLQPAHYRKLPHHDTLLKAIAAVPPDKSLVVPLRIVSHVATREHFGALIAFPQKPEYAAQFEYVILDANERVYHPAIDQAFFDQFYRNPDYQLRFAENNVFVFQRTTGESDWKIMPPQ